MKAVFQGDADKLRVAENESGRVVYVIEPKTFQPGIEELRRQFKQPTNRMMGMLLGNGENPVLEAYFTGLNEQAKFKNLMSEPQP
jgi:hypothetical protein